MTGASLTIRSLSKSFNGMTAVAGIDLDVPAGEFVSLLGPSGCGKTTTLRMIAGLELADTGAIHIDGRDVTMVAPQKRNLGMVFQHYALFPNLTAAENIAFPLRVRRMNRHEVDSRVEDLLNTVQLTAAASKYPHELSGGMQQRVALARALAISPPLLLLDEPLSALDAAIRDRLRTELRRLQRQLGVTVVYVTHDQAEAMALSDTVVVMEHGRISQVGSPRDLYDRPRSRFTAEFIGASNNRRSTVSKVGKDVSVTWGVTRLVSSQPLPETAQGTQVMVSWRPEAAHLVGPHASVSNSLSGSIDMITFMGPLVRLDIVIDGDQEPVTVDIVSSQATTFATGQTVCIAIPPDAIRLYPIV